jgi:hypothetical protein
MNSKTIYRVNIFFENSLSSAKSFETREASETYIAEFKANMAKHIASYVKWEKRKDESEHLEIRRLYVNIQTSVETLITNEV